MDTRIVECCHQMFQDMAETFGFRIVQQICIVKLQTYCLARSARFDPRQAFDNCVLATRTGRQLRSNGTWSSTTTSNVNLTARALKSGRRCVNLV